jgi:hypothetical protein
MSGFAIFSLDDPSLLVFHQRMDDRRAHLQYRSDAEDMALSQTLDGVDTAAIQALFPHTLCFLADKELWTQRMALGNYLAVSIDGTGLYCTSKQACALCLLRNKLNGQADYHHQLLAAVQVNPGQAAVFPLDAEPHHPWCVFCQGLL